MQEIFYLLNPHWEGKPLPFGLPRPAYLNQIISNFERREAQILVGSRRTGKTTVMFQAMQHLITERQVPANEILYVSLDHVALAQISIPEILAAFRAVFQHPRDRKLHLFFDEIPNSPDWSQHLKNLIDFEEVRLCIAGSNSLVLEQQGSYLTGRALRINFYPLSYPEFLAFKNTIPGPAEEYLHDGLLIEYLYQGGYPDQVLSPHPTYLQDLLDAIVNKDIVRVHNLKNPQVLSNLLALLAQRIGQRTSQSKLKNVLRVSQDLVKDYLGYLKQAYLIHEAVKFSFSLNEQVYAEKKYYFADTGVRTALVGRKDLGGLAENALFNFLQRRFERIFYGRTNGWEVDFVALKNSHAQVFEAKFTDDLDDEALQPIARFIEHFPGREFSAVDPVAIVATRNLSGERAFGQTRIKLVPLWQLLWYGLNT